MKPRRLTDLRTALPTLAAATGLLLLAGGCCTCRKASLTPAPVRSEMVARYTAVPPSLDGKLDDACWRNATAYHLSQSRENLEDLPSRYSRDDGSGIIEEGAAMLAWDDQFFYVAADLNDSDIVAEGKEDQQHHYSMGDVVEVFMKPETQTWYWEMYGTPAANKTCFFFPGRGRLWLNSIADYPCDIKVAAAIDGTLNNWQDRDQGWTVEFAIPLSQLTTGATAFKEGAPWRLLIARYNYSRYLPWKELSMAPQMNKANFHMLEEYASLRLVK